MNQGMVGGETRCGEKDMHRDIENTRIKGGKSERGWSMVIRKGSRVVFGPRRHDKYSKQILQRHLFHDILLIAISFPGDDADYGNSLQYSRPSAQTPQN